MTRQRAPATPPVVLTIAGSDSGGGAGIQADLKTIEAGGAFGTSAVTSVTAQHTRGVESTHVLPTGEVDAQCEAVRSDFDLGAVKTGMLATREIVELVTETVAAVDAPAVVDPVMVAASGDRLLDASAETAYERLASEAALLTPNADEATVLTGIEIETTEDAERAGEQLLADGAGAVLIKGGHVPGEKVTDLLVTGSGVQEFTHPRVETEATHGSGCMLSAAIATRLAHGDDLTEAVGAGIDLLGRAVRYGLDVGEGPGAVHHMVAARDQAAREPTAEAVRGLVADLVDLDISRLVPEVGTNVVGATPYAERPGECAAVEGRIGRTVDGVAPTGCVRFDASSHVARFLLAAREHEPDARFALNCRFDGDIEATLDTLDWPVGSRTAPGEPSGAVEQAFAGTGEPPVAVVDRGGQGREPTTKIHAPDAATLFDRVRTLLDAVE